MLNDFALPVSAALGFLAGLGVGGGSLLMLWLTLTVGMEYSDARTLNMLFFLPCATVSTFFRRKQCTVPFRKLFPAILAGCVASAVFAVIGKYTDNELLKKIFGCILLITGVREILYKPRK